jgi:GNAT superfamily N-acetyltransferase
MGESFRIRPATGEPAETEALADVLLGVVAGGASIGFMAPLSREKAVAFWRGCQSSALRGERVLLVARDAIDDELLGTVQVLLAMPDNGPHRADIAKMQVRHRARRRGLGAALMRAAEQAARDAGKTLLVLDTASPEAERLYERGGWKRVGEVPKYALLPDGPFIASVFFYKDLSNA